MDRIILKKIDESNFIEYFNLKLSQQQLEYVSHPIRSLAQAYVYYNQCIPFGIFNGEEKMVGYVMVIYDFDDEVYNIWHMMIDESEQSKGYGKIALKQLIEFIRTKPFGNSDKVILTCNKENFNAINLYKKYNFIASSKVIDNEIEMTLNLADRY